MKRQFLIVFLAVFAGVLMGAMAMHVYVARVEPWEMDPVVRWKYEASGPNGVPIFSRSNGQLYRLYVNPEKGGAEWGLVPLTVRESAE